MSVERALELAKELKYREEHNRLKYYAPYD